MRKIYSLMIIGLVVANFAPIAMVKPLGPDSVYNIEQVLKPTAGIQVTISNPINNCVVFESSITLNIIDF